ncbi:hypothetical protein [Streptomyces sp. NBC_01565]|uniref:hypothetical protein n=1 Tax=Streptomyces sp. NBC_01565 TaxID=2975881 RepID=UPI00224E2E59|nr:hypothetical protein [Streptomyces sp. NBC_01565]MCX4547250.1 hypothetical protein [Streptomyces sp. NBC_01565]
MSTTRRPLGHGPATGMSTSSDSTAQRLLPVERAGGDGLVDVVAEDQAVVQPPGRRVLGPGGSTSPGVS